MQTRTTVQQPLDAAHQFAEIACDIALQADVATAHQRIVELARTTLACDVVTLRASDPDGRLRLRAATHADVAGEYSRLLSETGSGPVWTALHTGETVITEDVATDPRWPDFGRRVATSPRPLWAAMAVPLTIGERARHGVLIFLSRSPGYFGDRTELLGRVFATHAAISLDSVTATQRAENLTRALESSRRIAAAVGIVMTTYRLPEAQAFDMLRAASQGLNRKLRDIADEVWLTGRLPDFTAGHCDDR